MKGKVPIDENFNLKNLQFTISDLIDKVSSEFNKEELTKFLTECADNKEEKDSIKATLDQIEDEKFEDKFHSNMKSYFKQLFKFVEKSVSKETNKSFNNTQIKYESDELDSQLDSLVKENKHKLSTAVNKTVGVYKIIEDAYKEKLDKFFAFVNPLDIEKEIKISRDNKNDYPLNELAKNLIKKESSLLNEAIETLEQLQEKHKKELDKMKKQIENIEEEDKEFNIPKCITQVKKNSSRKSVLSEYGLI